MTTHETMMERLSQLNTEGTEDASMVLSYVLDSATGRGLAKVTNPAGDTKRLPFTMTGGMVMFRGIQLAL